MRSSQERACPSTRTQKWVRNTGVLVAAAAMLLAVAACGGSGNGQQADGQVRVRLALLAEGYDAPLFYAKELGFFKQAGLDVDIRESTGSSTTTKLVGNGEADIGFPDLATAAKGIARDVPVKAIGAVFQKTPLATIFLRGKGISTPADLKGKKIGEQPGAATAQYFPAFRQAAGLTAQDVSEVNVDAGAREQLLLSGKIDAFNSYAIENVPILQIAHHAPADAFSWSDHGIKMLGMGILVNDEMISDHPDKLKAFMAAYAKGYQAAVANPKAAAEAILKEFPGAAGGSVAALQKQWELSEALQVTDATKNHPLFWMAPASWDDTLSVNAEFADTKSDKSSADYFTNDFIADVPKAGSPATAGE